MSVEPLNKMQRPWFRANNTASAIFAITNGHESITRPLVEGERALGWFILPPFQRPPVWTEAQKVRFIESIWGGLPLGSYIYNRTLAMESRFDNWLLDGQQRITAILEYVADSFPVLGYRWSELTKVDHRQFQMTPMSCMETMITDEAKLREVYDRLAYGGTPHDPSMRGVG
jgi:hypothetical protein